LPEYNEIANNFAISRSDNNAILGIVGKQYQPINNEEAFQFFDGVLGEGQGQIETCGALGIGEKVFMMAKMPEIAEIVPNDKIERYLLVHTSHDGKSATEVLFTNVRVVCSNTLNMAIRNSKSSMKIKHTKNWEEKMHEAQKVLIESHKHWEKVQETCKLLAETSVSRVEVGMYIDSLFPVKENSKNKVTENIKEKVNELIETGIGTDIKGVKGSAWGLYNAVTEYIDHHKTTKKGGNQWERSVFSANSINLRQRAFDQALALV